MALTTSAFLKLVPMLKLQIRCCNAQSPLAGLAQRCSPALRPAGAFIGLSPTYAAPPLLPLVRAAIDACITGLPHPPSGGGSSHVAPAAALCQPAEAAREKSFGPSASAGHSFVSSESVVCALNESNTAPTPFVMDPCGGLAPLVQRPLGGTELPALLRFASPAPQAARGSAASASAPSAALAWEDKSWSHTCLHASFGGSCCSWLPSAQGSTTP